jgi:hypothetical protein
VDHTVCGLRIGRCFDDGIGQVRCYATEDANPTKQLKNKLSQAAAASGGVLVLMLADESSFAKASVADASNTNAELLPVFRGSASHCDHAATRTAFRSGASVS